MSLEAILLTFLCVSCYGEKSKVPYYTELDSNIGRKEYDSLIELSPLYGDCWRRAVEHLEVECKYLTDDIQSRLALKFTNCFLEKSGRKIYPCPDSTVVKDCLQDVDSQAFISYNQFFTHTQNICFFLQNQVWQEHTKKTVNTLTSTSSKVSEQMLKTGLVQDKLLKLQELSMEAQKKFITHGEKLHSELENSRVSIRKFYEDQRVMMTDIFQHLAKIHNFATFILKEVSGVYSVAFYVGSLIVSYLVTSTKRTNSARVWLFLLLTANLLIEKMVTSYSIDEEYQKDDIFDSEGPVYSKIWLSRQIFTTLAFLMLVWNAYKYKDYAVLNNRLLMEIHQQNLELQKYIKDNTNRSFTFRNNSDYLFADDASSDESYKCPEDSSDESGSENTLEGSTISSSTTTESGYFTPTESSANNFMNSPKLEEFVPGRKKYNLRSRNVSYDYTSPKNMTKTPQKREENIRQLSNLGVFSDNEL